jgi:hypothetical protein
MSENIKAIPIPPELFTQACKAYFGHHPIDVIKPTEWVSDTMEQLEAIFRAIAKVASSDKAGRQIKALADAGAYLATDFCDFGGGEYEKLRDNLKAAGIEIHEP